MHPERRKRIEALFEEALDRSPATRREWLRTVCGTDAELHRGVLRLLNGHERAEGILDRPRPVMPRVAAAEMRPCERRIGSYRLIREVGRGGMSIVYLAERDDRQYRQAVAVKVIRRGLDSPDLVQRFCAERQILASLTHPHIARLLDGGTTEDGLPYLVMEYVAGEPITDYCDRKRLTLEQRLRLFVTVARTVQYAHQNLVVHRDLKPSNILVTEPSTTEPGDGELKLLDFGIAKLLDPGASPAEAPQTRPGLRLMTPEYASPEQISGETVTTATDVYGLGLLLYELLTARHPFHWRSRGRRDRSGGEDELRPPSSVVARDAQAGHARRIRPERLRRKLRGDLDRIVITALRDQPERRYPSAEQMAEDVEHYLHRRPVRARGNSVSYRLSRFAARHRWGIAVAAVLAVLFAGYAATITVKEREVRVALERASVEAERAEQVSSFLMRLFEATHPNEVGSDSITARELLARGASRAEMKAHEPAAQAQMLDVIGRTYQYLGQHDRAEPLLERALSLRRARLGDEHPRVTESLHHLASLHHARGRLDSAETLYRRALQDRSNVQGAEAAQTARTLDGLARVLQDRGEYGPAESVAREALDLRLRVLGNDHPEVAESLHNLAEVLRRGGKYGEAEPLLRDALALRQRVLSHPHPAVAETMGSLAALLQRRGDVSEVESLYLQADAIYRGLFGASHPATATNVSSLGLFMFRMGDLEAADSLYRQALAVRREVLGPEHPDVALSLGLLAAVQRRMGHLSEAETLYRASLAMQRRLLGDEHPDLGHGINGLAMVMRDRRDFAAADSLYREVLTMRLRLLGHGHSSVATTLNDRGVLMREWGRYAEAEPLLLEGLRLRRQTLNEGHRQIEQSIRHLMTLYERWDRPEQAAAYRTLLGDG